MKRALPFAEVVERHHITADLMKLWLAPSFPLSFVPGQYCTIALNDIPRPYSICSTPKDSFLELFIRLVPPPLGNLTPLLWELSVGDKVVLYPKTKGVFALDPAWPNHVMVATGTGVAPFVSMARAHLGMQAGRLFLLYGVRFQDEFGYHDELSQMEHLRYFPAVSKPELPENAGWSGLGGRVTKHITHLLSSEGLTPDNACVYACGNPDMIEDVKTMLVPQGYFVKEEQYWKNKPDKKGGAA